MSTFQYIGSHTAPCEICGRCDDCRINITGGVHCRHSDPISPPAGWHVAVTDSQGFHVYYRDGDDGSRLTDWARRQMEVGAASRRHAKKEGHTLDGKKSSVILLEKWKRPMTDAERGALAKELNLTADCFAHLDVEFVEVGWTSGSLGGAAWVTPERDASGRTVGYALRYVHALPDGSRKRNLGNRGIYLPRGWNMMSGPIHIPEGMSDTLSLVAMGLRAIGRPSARCPEACSMIGEVIRTHGLHLPGACRLVVVGEHDRDDAKGTWPGRDGAEASAATIAEAVGCEVYVSFPPPGYKDVREFVGARLLELQARTITDTELGRIFAAHVERTAVIWGRPPEVTAADTPVTGVAPLPSPRVADLAGAARPDLLPPPRPATGLAGGGSVGGSTGVPVSKCPHPQRPIMRHPDRRRTRFYFVDCGRLDCSVCGPKKRNQLRATVKHHMTEAARLGCTDMSVCWVEAREWDSITMKSSYFRLDLGDGRYFVVSILPPLSGRGISGTMTVTTDEAIRRLWSALDLIPLRQKCLSHSKDWSLIGNARAPREQGWHRVGQFVGSRQRVAEILAYHRVDWDPKSQHGRFFGWDAFEVPDARLPDGVTVDHLIGDVQIGEPTDDFDPFAKDDDAAGETDEWAPRSTGPPGHVYVDFAPPAR